MFLKKVDNFKFYHAPLVILYFFLISCQMQDQKIIKRTQFIMGTLIEITVLETDKNLAQKAISKSFEEMSRLENIMSTHRHDSELSKLNISASSKKRIPASPDLLEVIQRGIHWGKLSNGAMDISIGPAIALWKFDAESPTLPNPQELISASDLVDYREISIEGSSIGLKQTGMSLHLGAIAKGYAVDRAVEILKFFGINSGIVNAGGDLMAFGSKKGITPWRIGIQHPRKPEEMIVSLALKDKAVATSGDYQKYFILDETRYHHILNPEDGWPSSEAISATVIADTVTDADALSTALFILGAEKGLRLINSLEGVEGMIFSNLESASFSSGFRSLPGLSLQGLKENLSQ